MATTEVLMPSRRISAFISESAYDAFMSKAREDGISMSDRIATLVQLWEQNDIVHELVESEAPQVSRERRRQRYDRGRTTG